MSSFHCALFHFRSNFQSNGLNMEVLSEILTESLTSTVSLFVFIAIFWDATFYVRGTWAMPTQEFATRTTLTTDCAHSFVVVTFCSHAALDISWLSRAIAPYKHPILATPSPSLVFAYPFMGRIHTVPLFFVTCIQCCFP